jgi:protein-tyrosine-phosphatase
MTRTGALSQLRRIAGRARRAIRNWWDGMLHPSRHRATIARLRADGRPRSILVVCHGNICRSPYLAAVLAHALPDLEVSSAGFIGAGREVPPHSLTVASRRGLDLSNHRSQLLSRHHATQADLFVVMDPGQAAALGAGFGVPRGRVVVAGDLERRFGTSRAIEDPWHKDLDVFESSFGRLDRCAEVLVTAITAGSGRP